MCLCNDQRRPEWTVRTVSRTTSTENTIWTGIYCILLAAVWLVPADISAAQSPPLDPVDGWRPWNPSQLGTPPAAAPASAPVWRANAGTIPHVARAAEDPSVGVPPIAADGLAPPNLGPGPLGATPTEPWQWQLMPTGVMYRSYLAGVKESRLYSGYSWFDSGGTFWQPTVGGRVPLLRYGTVDPISPEGFQVDAEGAAILRLDVRNNVDLVAADFRGGVIASFGDRRSATKLAYYHMSSHVGDEFLLSHPGFNRLNWSRDTLVVGRSYMLTEWLRIYGEVGWAFYTDVTEPWEFQFGVEYAPFCPTGPRGAPFFAANAHLRQELDFGGNLTVQTGWAWRSRFQGSLLRIGFEYYNGKSSQYSFYNMFEEQFTIGVWYDY